MTKEEIIEECKQRLGFDTDYEMYSLCKHERDFYNAIIDALEQNTVSEEIYTEEYNVRKQAEYELWKIKKQQSSEDCVSRDAIRLKIAEMPKYTDGRKVASIRHLEDFLEKEIEEPIEVTQDICIGFTIALECIRDFITALPPATPTHGTCEYCLNHGINKQHEDIDGARYYSSFHTYTGYDFYCADYEKAR